MADQAAVADVQLDADGKPLSKKALKKQQKDAEKNLRKAETATKLEAEASARVGEDCSKGLYGISPLIQSTGKTDRKWTPIRELVSARVGQTLLIRARVHTRRGAGKLCFLVLRQQYHTVQAVVAVCDSVSKQMVRFASDLHLESIIDIEGLVTAAPELITSCSQQNIELKVTKIFCISQAVPQLPLQIEDAMRPDQSEVDGPSIHVNQDTKLDNRIIDLRTTTNQAIFRVEAAVCRLFREYLTSQKFVEIHTPKIISAASEGGANVFEVTYFKGQAYLAQSPQLYKQMALCGDFDRVFTIGADMISFVSRVIQFHLTNQIASTASYAYHH